MPTKGPVQDYKRERKNEKRKALNELNKLRKEKPSLKRPVFFVPGWTGEEGWAWLKPYPKLEEGHLPIKHAIDDIFRNSKIAECITFTVPESESCNSFLDFANILKGKIQAFIRKNEEFDIVGHSMGGLDLVASITQGKDYLTNVYSCITVASPLKGTEFGELRPILGKLLPFLGDLPPHHEIQCKNLDPDRKPIQIINTLKSRENLLNRINKFYQFVGTRDMAVMRNAKLRKDGLELKFYREKIITEEIGGATHSGKTGITQDPRVVKKILQILLGRYQSPKYNYGYIYRKNA